MGLLSMALVGAGAGAAATVPQSAVVWGLRRAGVYQRPPAPEQVSERASRPVVNVRRLPTVARVSLTAAEHVGFGAAAGAVYGLVSHVARPNAVTGLLAGLGVWAMSYAGWLPAAQLMPAPHKDEPGRQAAVVLAHIAYGVTLGVLTQRWAKRYRP
jgi:hypothetical protein